MRFAKFSFVAAVAALSGAAIVAPAPAAAQDNPTVTLKSFDGFTQLRGELLGFDDGNYTVKTPLGVIEVSALHVECEGEGCPQNLLFGAEFGIYGSSTLGEQLIPTLLEGYAFTLDADLEREVGNVDNESTLRIRHVDGREMAVIDLKAHGSSMAFPALASGEAAIGMSSRPARDSDVAQLNEGGLPDPRDSDSELIVALDGLAIIVHPENPIRSLGIVEIAEIFAGEISNWSEVGGPNAPIKIFARDNESGTFDTFNTLLLRPEGLEIAPGAQRFDDDVALSDSVASDPNAIGFTGIAFVRAAKAVALRQECGILSYPNSFAMKTEEYPFTRRLFLYGSSKETPLHVDKFIEYVQSEEAQTLIEESGFISSAYETRTLAEQGDRLVNSIAADEELSLPLLREMVAELREAERLSATFRFTPGSSRLDPRSTQEAERLAAQINNGDYSGRELLLVGFTDAIGQFDLNRDLSVRRAQGVLEEILSRTTQAAVAATPVAVQGYGELTPVGCNDSFQGRFANRRVEVWVRDRRN